MPAVVVDTDVVSFVFKGSPLAELYQAELLGNTLVISFMTLAELERWAVNQQWGALRRAALHQYLHRFVVQHSTHTLCQQ
jgi:predicted nucleic acid-binding protein